MKTNDTTSEIKIKHFPKKESMINKLSYNLVKGFLYFIPSFLKKKKKLFKPNEQGLPYIVCVENNTSKEIHNVELFGSYYILTRDVFDKEGNYVSRGLKISSNIPNVTYKDILHSMAFMKFKVGLTYVMTTNKKQISHPLKVVKKMISGYLSEKILVVTKDPFQQQINIVAVKSDYEIDGLTSVVIPKIEPKTKALYYFYPDPLAYSEVKKENLAFRFFKSISDYFKKKEVVKGKSVPFTIEVANYTDEVKKNVSLFGSYMNVKSIYNKSNSLVINDVLISSLTPNISYAEMIHYFSNNETTIGFTYIRNSQGNAGQITSEYKILNKDAKGNLAQRTILPIIDPYQQQNDVLSNNQKFRIDGFTELVISELQPKTTVVYQFYPEVEIVKK